MDVRGDAMENLIFLGIVAIAVIAGIYLAKKYSDK
jgi:hypothetical protein